MDPKIFEEKKDVVIDNIDILMTRLEVCVESGMLDIESAFYNKVYDLRDDADEIETPEELSEIIERAKAVEMNLDRWLSTQGNSTIALSWPDVKEGPTW